MVCTARLLGAPGGFSSSPDETAAPQGCRCRAISAGERKVYNAVRYCHARHSGLALTHSHYRQGAAVSHPARCMERDSRLRGSAFKLPGGYHRQHQGSFSTVARRSLNCCPCMLSSHFSRRLSLASPLKAEEKRKRPCLSCGRGPKNRSLLKIFAMLGRRVSRVCVCDRRDRSMRIGTVACDWPGSHDGGDTIHGQARVHNQSRRRAE